MPLALGMNEQFVNELVATELRGLSEAWEPELRPLDEASPAMRTTEHIAELRKEIATSDQIDHPAS